MSEIYHAIGMNMHQPPGNLLRLHNSDEQYEAKQILWCYDRPNHMLEGYEDVARLHMSFSGTLLKQFEDPAIRETFHDVVNIESLLHRYQQSNIEFVGTGLYHPVYPLTPPEDWDAHTSWWIGLGQHLLGRDKFNGFWPPEMGFCMEMIPMLKRHGYRYVIVDCWYIKPNREMRWEELRYRPYLASYEDEQIIVIPRDRELSDAQESGLDPRWFQHELSERTKGCDFPALVTTWTDGENGGWFRTSDVENGFWGYFLHPILNKFRQGTLGFTPVHITEFLDRYPPVEEVEVHRGAWNTGQHWGGDFMQWTGSLLQKKGWKAVHETSAYYQKAKRLFDQRHHAINNSEEIRYLIESAYDHILTAETSCNFYWGSRWVYQSFDELEKASNLLDRATDQMSPIPRSHRHGRA